MQQHMLTTQNMSTCYDSSCSRREIAHAGDSAAHGQAHPSRLAGQLPDVVLGPHIARMQAPPLAGIHHQIPPGLHVY